jgi:adenosylmethionine-8-amino-7-oxononanoate aminotransferase
VGPGDGVRGDHVLIAPPYIVTDGEVDRIVGLLGEAVDAVTAMPR